MLGVNGKIPLCPDLLRRKAKSVIEVKGSGYAGNRITVKQMAKYSKLLNDGFEVWYALCGYHRIRNKNSGSVLKTLPKQTYTKALEFLAQNTNYILLLDFEIVQKLIDYYGTYKYPKWDTEYYRMSPGRCLQFVNKPSELFDVLNLDRQDYVVIQTFADSLEIAGNKVNSFPVTFIIKREEQSLNIAPEQFKVIKDILTDKREQEAEVSF